jgi:hypothetical protein
MTPRETPDERDEREAEEREEDRAALRAERQKFTREEARTMATHEVEKHAVVEPAGAVKHGDPSRKWVKKDPKAAPGEKPAAELQEGSVVWVFEGEDHERNEWRYMKKAAPSATP